MTTLELLLLGLIAETPQYGYQLEQTIEQRGMREWTEIGFSSIYYILNKLESANLVFSEKHTEGDRPARKVYNLTENGFTVLRKGILDCLRNPRINSSDFLIGLAYAPVCTSDEVKAALQTNLLNLQSRLENVYRKQELSGGTHLPLHVRALFDHSISMMEAEIQSIQAILSTLNNER